MVTRGVTGQGKERQVNECDEKERFVESRLEMYVYTEVNRFF